MEPDVTPSSLQDLAIYDPVAALGIALHIPRIPISINAKATFSDFTALKTEEASLDTTISQRTWIDNVQYSLLLPNVFAGNIFTPLYMSTLKQQPGLSIKILTLSGPRYLVCPEFTPLENFTGDFKARWQRGWPLFKFQTIQVQYQLTNPPPSSSPNGPPYIVTTTFNGWQFLDHTIENVSPDDAADRLRAMGFCVPAVPCVRD